MSADNKKFLGVLIFIILVAIIYGFKVFNDLKSENNLENNPNYTTVYVAYGGGKEDFLFDEEVNKILKNKYKLNVVYDYWSNGKTITEPLIREYVKEGNKDIVNKMQNGEEFTINSEGVSKYDALFTSDQRYYDIYKTTADPDKGESPRYRVLGGGLTLNTPIVVYSWNEVTDVLIKENIVKLEDDIYYIEDMTKLMDYIMEAKKWKDLGLDIGDFKYVNIDSVDPVSSSPGLTYYGLLLSILSKGIVTKTSTIDNLPYLANFYEKSGYMGVTPADLFDSYLRTGYATRPLIVDYEKSMIEFANSQPNSFAELKDKVKILYPSPTIWNSHCLAYFTEGGKKLYEAYEDEEIQQIAWSKYGFRVGVANGKYDVTSLGLAIPQTIKSTVSGFKAEYYDIIKEYLSAPTNKAKEEVIENLKSIE